jgi:hypothetical protein
VGGLAGGGWVARTLSARKPSRTCVSVRVDVDRGRGGGGGRGDLCLCV